MRTCERINGLAVILSGYLTMANGLAGRQWNEGDVSDSVVRRVMMPDSFFACDGLLESTLHVLDDFGAFSGRIEAELNTRASVPHHYAGPHGRGEGRAWGASRPTG